MGDCSRTGVVAATVKPVAPATSKAAPHQQATDIISPDNRMLRSDLGTFPNMLWFHRTVMYGHGKAPSINKPHLGPFRTIVICTFIFRMRHVPFVFIDSQLNHASRESEILFRHFPER